MFNLPATYFLVVFIFTCIVSGAQDFEYLSPVVTKNGSKTDHGYLLLNTQDSHRDLDNNNAKAYCHSIQIIDASLPWPPVWYTATPRYSNEMFTKDSVTHRRAFNWLLDAKIEHGYLSFYKSQAILNDHDSVISKLVAGYILLNKRMEPIDTISCNINGMYIYWHDFRINSKGERLVDYQMREFLDLRSLTGDRTDNAVLSQTDLIEVLDSTNKIIFSWKATDHLDPTVFQYTETLHKKSFVHNSSNREVLDWSHLTSAIWDYDGNILYSMRWIGIGKISRKDGHVIWHIDFKDLPIVSGIDTIQWYSPHDFNFLHTNDTSAIYSIYSCGQMHDFADSNKSKNGRGVIFELDIRTNKIKLLRYLNPSFQYITQGQGGCDYQDSGNYLISYGQGIADEQNVNNENYCSAFEWRKNDSIFTIYQLPRYVGAFKVHELHDWPLPLRPEIIFENNVLEASGEMNEWTWYKMTGPGGRNPIKVGKGKTLVPEIGYTYCVVGKYGMGYCVSLPYGVKGNNHTSLLLFLLLASILLSLMALRLTQPKKI